MMLRRGIIISMALVILVIAITGGVLLGLRLEQGASGVTTTTCSDAEQMGFCGSGLGKLVLRQLAAAHAGVSC